MSDDQILCKIEEQYEMPFPPPINFGNYQNFDASQGKAQEDLFFENQRREHLQRLSIRQSKMKKKQNKTDPTDAKIKKINQRRGKYKRSTNNSHKKFICVARRLLFKFLSEKERDYFQKEYLAFKNSRAYYFIILAFVKLKLSSDQVKEFIKTFVLMMNNKIEIYKKEMRKTDNKNFINFRYDEISDIQYAMKAFELYFQNKLEESIETIYKKQKITVLKKHQFEKALSTVRQLQRQLLGYGSGSEDMGIDRMEEVQNHYRSSIKLRKQLPPPAKIDIRDIIKTQQLCKEAQAQAKPKKSDLYSTKDSRIQEERMMRYKFQEENEKFAQINLVHQYPLILMEHSFPLHPFFFPESYVGYINEFTLGIFQPQAQPPKETDLSEKKVEGVNCSLFSQKKAPKRTQPDDQEEQISA